MADFPETDCTKSAAEYSWSAYDGEGRGHEVSFPRYGWCRLHRWGRTRSAARGSSSNCPSHELPCRALVRLAQDTHIQTACGDRSEPLWRSIAWLHTGAPQVLRFRTLPHPEASRSIGPARAAPRARTSLISASRHHAFSIDRWCPAHTFDRGRSSNGSNVTRGSNATRTMPRPPLWRSMIDTSLAKKADIF